MKHFFGEFKQEMTYGFTIMILKTKHKVINAMTYSVITSYYNAGSSVGCSSYH